MKQENLLAFDLKTIGEDIGLELGAKMIKDFQDAHSNEIPAHFVGSTILKAILTQPDCSGIKFFHALNEFGRKTLVYVGINSRGEVITDYSQVTESGELISCAGVIGDRTRDEQFPEKIFNWSW